MSKNKIKMAYFLALNGLKRENRQTSLGYLWLIINPLITAVTFGLVWGIFMPGKIENQYDQLPWLLTGFFPWFLVSEGFIKGSFSIVDNKNLVTKIVFPIYLLPVIEIIKVLFKFIILTAILIIVLLIYNIYPTMNWIWLGYALFCAITFLWGVTRMFSVVVTFYRDFGNLLNSIMQLLLWASGVLLSISRINNEIIKTAILINPFAYIVNVFRYTFLNDPNAFLAKKEISIIFWIINLTIMFIGNYLFKTKQKEFGDAL
jgi:teichoic acid transport system permease protein